jgi:SAM-dependent methyltransferase
MSVCMGRFERKYFDEAYRNYAAQNPPRKLRFYRELAALGARGAGPRRILDLGCAFGTFLASLGPAWSRFGIDVSAYAVEEASRRVPDACFAVAHAGEIPFEGPFDVVTAFDVLEHIADLQGALQALLRSLAPGGALVLVVPVYDGPTGPLIRRLDSDETHLHKESRRFWIDWVGGSGLQLEDWWGVYRYLLPGGFYPHWPTRALRRWTPAIAMIARKPT